MPRPLEHLSLAIFLAVGALLPTRLGAAWSGQDPHGLCVVGHEAANARGTQTTVAVGLTSTEEKDSDISYCSATY